MRETPSAIQDDLLQLKQRFASMEQRIYSAPQLHALLKHQRAEFPALKRVAFRDMIEWLLEHASLQRFEMAFPHRTETRFLWGEPDVALLHALVQSLRPEGYFSHYSAMYLHELTESIPKVLYLNAEQSPKPWARTELTQDGIDAAFGRPVRVSAMRARLGEWSVCLLNGMHTDNLGVIPWEMADGCMVRVSNLERTLIDSTVRPVYAGGASEVARAFDLAGSRVSVSRLCAMLKQMNHAYPYHQAVGYYLERTGQHTASSLQLLKDMGMRFDFHLTHGIKRKTYCEAWRLFVPEGM